MSSHWENLVSETQFATELTVLGLRKLCSVPVAPWVGGPFGYDQSYPLHVGLHSFTSGLERLCKLTIACHGYLVTGEFPPLKLYGHRIGQLLDAVEDLDLHQVRPARPRHLPRPTDDLDPELTNELERFANGSGRYEHLDSLLRDNSDVQTNEVWLRFCGTSEVSEKVQHLLAMRSAVVGAIRDLCTEGDLEAAGFAFLDKNEVELFEASVGVALRLHAKARWVASILALLTDYTTQSLPILDEVVNVLRRPSDDFFQYSIAQIEDEYITEEELVDHFRRRAELPDEDTEDELEVFTDD